MISLLFTFFQVARTYLKLLLRRGTRTSYSQNGEDALLQSFFEIPVRGFYVDVGTYHPTLYSNTFALYQKGWRGLVIDPNHTLKGLFLFVRPRDRFMSAGIGKQRQRKTYFCFSDGAYNTFDDAVAEVAKKNPHIRFLGERQVAIYPLAEVVRTHRLTNIDVLNVDTEGLDLEVLQSHDWNVPPRVIMVEDHSFCTDSPHNSLIYRYLKERGYTLDSVAHFTLLFRFAKKQ